MYEQSCDFLFLLISKVDKSRTNLKKKGNSQRPHPAKQRVYDDQDATPPRADAFPSNASHNNKSNNNNTNRSEPSSPSPPSSPACPGCGAVLQCECERRIGYIPRNRMAANEPVPEVLRMDKDFQALMSYVPDAGATFFLFLVSSFFSFFRFFAVGSLCRRHERDQRKFAAAYLPAMLESEALQQSAADRVAH
jgi:hypothetical protein